MTFLQMGDIHLGVDNNRLPAQKAKIMADEQLSQLGNLFEYAKQNQIEAIFITGDLFHSKNPSLKLSKVFFNMVAKSGIKTFYVRGNHDEDFVSKDLLPENFVVFGKDMTTYSFEDYTVSGAELPCEKAPVYADNRFHFLLLHGDIFNPKSSDGINLSNFKDKGIDYIALGHIHSFCSEKLDDKGVCVYSGSLFANGFDECGDKGFVEIDIKNGQLSYQFKTFAKRKFVIVTIDISQCYTFSDYKKLLQNKLNVVPKDYLVRVVLTGYFYEESEKYISLLKKEFEENYFYFEIKDESKLKIDFEKIKGESLSFKAEFLKLVEEDNSLTNKEKNAISQCGIEALRGDDLSV